MLKLLGYPVLYSQKVGFTQTDSPENAETVLDFDASTDESGFTQTDSPENAETVGQHHKEPALSCFTQTDSPENAETGRIPGRKAGHGLRFTQTDSPENAETL